MTESYEPAQGIELSVVGPTGTWPVETFPADVLSQLPVVLPPTRGRWRAWTSPATDAPSPTLLVSLSSLSVSRTPARFHRLESDSCPPRRRYGRVRITRRTKYQVVTIRVRQK